MLYFTQDAQLRRKLSRTGYDGQFLYPERGGKLMSVNTIMKDHGGST